MWALDVQATLCTSVTDPSTPMGHPHTQPTPHQQVLLTPRQPKTMA